MLVICFAWKKQGLSTAELFTHLFKNPGLNSSSLLYSIPEYLTVDLKGSAVRSWAITFKEIIIKIIDVILS